MKIEQQQTFQPIRITLETQEEVMELWGLIDAGAMSGKPEVREIAIRLSNWLSNCAQLGGGR